MKILKHAQLVLVTLNILLAILAYRGFFQGKDILPVVFAIVSVLLGLIFIWISRTALPKYRLIGFALVVMSALGLYHVHFNIYNAERMEASRSRSMEALEKNKAPAVTFVHAINIMDAFNVDTYTAGNRFTILNFWATWCAPCLKEMPMLDEFYRTHKDQRVGVIGFTEFQGDELEAMNRIRETIHQVEVQYPILIDSTTAVRVAYKADILPATVLLNQNGEVVDYQIGIDGAKKIMRFVTEQMESALNN
ncbi:TlpA disulfide reductase family protein [Robertkochia aurantiaca]|uniref:TlpA disulfide reductase family protein n=1 Tax=Robertkochia aurantiaca TaxID=2873700 RepID=UPI001CCF6E6D|nr:TlpA disulfide reductase family protein [Robertkochia sp. 3YJGBD-33]